MALAARPVVQTHLCVTARERPHGLLRRASTPPDPLADPALEALLALAQRASTDVPLWLTGGEPCLRADLPTLVARLREAGFRVGLVSDGQSLSRPGALEALREAGLERLRLALHSSRADAHDWLVGKPGACRAVLRTARRGLEAGFTVELAATLTRPTAPHLAEWVQLVARLGAHGAHLTRWTIPTPGHSDAILLSPRLALLEDTLEAAAAAAVAFKLPLTMWELPHCAAPRLRSLHGRRELLLPADAAFAGFAGPEHSRSLCGACSTHPDCPGAPSDYLERFGAAEFMSEQPRERAGGVATAVPPDSAAPVVADSELAEPVPPPAPRAGRSPATRVRFGREQAARSTLQGDPIGGVPPGPVPAVVRLGWGSAGRAACPSCGDAGQPGRSARDNRRLLVLAAQQGSRALRIASADAFSHPEARSLLPDATQLSFERVEVAGEAGALAGWRDDELAKLKRFQRVRAALYGPDARAHDQHMGCEGAFDATLQGLARLGQKARVEVGCYGVLHDHADVSGYAEAWQAGRLPGAPAFRLSAAGGSLRELANAAAALPEGPARAALAAVLPACLLPRTEAVAGAEAAGSAIGRLPAVLAGVVAPAVAEAGEAPSGSDPLGEFLPCRCGPELAARCPGRAVGWELDA